MKLDLILENVRNTYTIGLLEESSIDEATLLQGKILINESTMQIRKMLIDDNIMENTIQLMKQLFQEALIKEDVGIGGVSSAGVMSGSAGPIPVFGKHAPIIQDKKIKN